MSYIHNASIISRPATKALGLIVIGIVTLLSVRAEALEDGWYQARKATGECSEALKGSVLAIQSDKPLSLSAEGQSAVVTDPVKIGRKPNKMHFVSERGSATVEIMVNGDKSITLKVLEATECKGAQIVFAR